MNTYVTEIIVEISDIIKFSEDVKVYPNPFNLNTIIVFPNPDHKKFVLNIMDITGKKIKSYRNIKTNSIELKRDNITSGVYFFRLISEDGKVYNGKMVIN